MEIAATAGQGENGIEQLKDGIPVFDGRDDVAKVRTTPKKVAIVGGGRTRVRAPFRDSSWDIWAFSSRNARYRRISRWFEIHHMTDLRQQLASRKRGRRTFRGYIRYMKRLKCPVYTHSPQPNIPKSVVFPKDELIERFGRCFTSTAAFLVGLAIMEGYEVIGLWGIDLKGPEYIRQRPALRYLLGLARQQGIKVYVPRGSTLRIPRKPKFVRTRVLYAYDWRSKYAWWRYRLRKKRKRK